jgi:hypothetical protein
MARKRVVGWKLPADERDRLLERFRPVYRDLVADHVTLQAGAPKGTPLPAAASGRVVGIADDGSGVQALVVEIDGTTRRPDGSTYHITWSLDRAAGRRPVESNDVIRVRGWRDAGPIEIRLEPALF